MLHELVMIGDGDKIITRNADGCYLVPLKRGFNGTQIESHPEGGLWGVVSSPSFHDLGRDRALSTILIRLPDMDEQTNTVLVYEEAASYLDVGMIITRYDIVQ